MSTEVKSNPADLRGVITKRVQVEDIVPDGLIEINECIEGEFAEASLTRSTVAFVTLWKMRFKVEWMRIAPISVPSRCR